MFLCCNKLVIISLDKDSGISDYSPSSPILINSFHLKFFAFIFKKIRPDIFFCILVTI